MIGAPEREDYGITWARYEFADRIEIMPNLPNE